MNRTKTLAFFLSAALLAGCQSSRSSTENAEGPKGVFEHADPKKLAVMEYRVEPPDDVLVKAPNIKELDGQKQKVRPDGKITLPLLNDVYVAGMTPDEINKVLTEQVGKIYANPDVRVEIIANSKFYYVFGFGTARQGRFAWTGRDSVITALAEAGFNEGSWPQQVRVSRPGKDGQENATAVVDFKRIWDYGDMSQNYLLREGDIVHIPDSPLTRFNNVTTKMFGPITGAAGAVSAGQVVTSPGGRVQ
jgi:protein involved in polysaccharide export with SLBB domain